jgi:hypothetical protein
MGNFSINVDVLSSEWAPVIGVGLAFFAVQLFLCATFCFRLRRQEGSIKRLCRDFELGGNGRHDVQRASRNSAWTHWVLSHFPNQATYRSNHFTRDDALQELDTRIASNGNYLLLQRMGVMAPLLGVVLTVAGFYWLKVGEQEESLQSILMAVAPLISGVGAGAVLALINQALLHIAGRRVESLRMTARNWFDTVIWGNFNLDAQASPANAVRVMEHFVRTSLDDINRLNETLTRAAEVGVAISALPVQIRKILDRKSPGSHNAAPTGQSERFVAPIPRPAAVTRPVTSK